MAYYPRVLGWSIQAAVPKPKATADAGLWRIGQKARRTIVDSIDAPPYVAHQGTLVFLRPIEDRTSRMRWMGPRRGAGSGLAPRRSGPVGPKRRSTVAFQAGSTVNGE